MKVKDLPQPIKDLAIIRSKQENDEFNIGSDTMLAAAFLFFETPENEDFWHEINKGHFQVFYDKYTHGFKEGDVVKYEDEEDTYIIGKLKVISKNYDSDIYITLIKENNKYSTVTMNMEAFCNYEPYLIKNKNEINEKQQEHFRHESEGDLSNGNRSDRRESDRIQFGECTIENSIKHSEHKERSCLREVQVSKIAI